MGGSVEEAWNLGSLALIKLPIVVLSLLYLLFKILKILMLGPRLLRRSLGPHVRGSVKIMVKLLNSQLLSSLNFWDNQ